MATVMMNLTALLTLLCFGLVASQIASTAQQGPRVADPYSEEGFTCAGKPDGQLFNSTDRSGPGAFRLRADLNFDGREDVILLRQGAPVDGNMCTNSGCPVVIYLKQSDERFVKKDFWLHPLAVSLSKSRDGEGTLSTYGRISAQEGRIADYRVSADTIVQIRLTDYNAGISEDVKLYGSLFGSTSAVRAEYASCQGGTLTWSLGN